MGIYLGLDLGGTRRRWAWSGSREVHELPGGIQAARGAGRAAAELARLLAEIGRGNPGRTPDFTGIGMAGAGDPSVAAAIAAGVGEAGIRWPLVVVGDVVAAAAAALGDGPGIVLWSGTGSFAVGRDAAGRLHRVGGRGHLIGDVGSAHDIVRSAGVAAVNAADGTGPETGLTEAVAKAFGCTSPSQLGPAMQRRSPAGIASACPVVLECAGRGDEVARRVLRTAASGLAGQAAAAARQSALDPESTDLSLGGGVLERASVLRDMLGEALQSLGFRRCPTTVSGGAAPGSVILAEALHRRRPPMCDWVERGGTA